MKQKQPIEASRNVKAFNIVEHSGCGLKKLAAKLVYFHKF